VELSKASQTALGVALRRAVHQLHDAPLVLNDPVAVPILRAAYGERLQAMAEARDERFSRSMRAFLVARSRYAEDRLNDAVAAGVSQYVLLGAGLDTFAYRNPHPQLRVFEVDHPATQQWKRELLASSGVAIPASLRYAPVDFEVQTLSAQLEFAGFDAQAPAFVAWLGVVPYLTLAAFRATLGFIAARPAGSGVVFDYGQPRKVLPLADRLVHDALAARVRSAGEPFQLFFTPADVARELAEFTRLEDLGTTEMNGRYFKDRADKLAARGAGGRIVSAWR
jgi:methyltransferase (TIGR00027 family)